MPEYPSTKILKLDPWSASSLLQKSIRRGETELAQHAALLFYRYRGTAIWRRLFHIAVEDVGIANITLVADIASLATDKPLRQIVGPDAELIHDLCGRLTSSPKDRSADYLYSMVRREGVEPRTYDPETGVGKLVTSAVQLFRHCAVDRNGQHTINEAAVRQLFKEQWEAKSPSLEHIMVRAAKSQAHPFTLMLLPLWSTLTAENLEVSVTAQPLPATEWIDGVPLLTFDKHTAVGKAAISSFAIENLHMRHVLSNWVAAPQRAQVTEIAAFYADAAPISRQFRWSKAKILGELGCQADMIIAGCEVEGIQAVLEVTRDNLADLNARRRRFLGRAKK